MRLHRTVIVLLLAGSLAACHDKMASPEPLTGGNPKIGQKLVAQFGCGACHQIKGIAHADSQVGPSLKEIRSSSYIGGVLPNSADNLMKWIMHPRAINPKTDMPELGVTEPEARDIAAYLYSQ
jgi:cytochrome c2